MNNYKEYTQKVEGLGKNLTGMLGLKLTYIKSKSDGIETYTNYLSSKFFPKKEKITQYDIEERFTIIESALQEYKEIENEIRNDQYLTQKLKEFLIKKIKESSNKAEIAKRAIFFEAEKFGYDIFIEGGTFEIKKNQEKVEKIGLQKNFEEKKHIYVKEIDNLQTEIYGPKISDIENEKNIIISICNEKYQKNKENLSKKEKEIFEIFLNKFKENIGKAPQDKKNYPQEVILVWKLLWNELNISKKHFIQILNGDK